MASSTKQITLGGVKYTLVKQIGRGAYGQVWCALDDKNQEFAIKLEDKSQFVHSNFGIAKEMNVSIRGIKIDVFLFFANFLTSDILTKIVLLCDSCRKLILIFKYSFYGNDENEFVHGITNEKLT